MKDKELKLNASGYKDEPCYKTIMTLDAPKPGEIWENGNTRKLVLVLANMNGICTILNLTDQEKENRIKVTSRVPMYTAPNMVCYCFTPNLVSFVKTLTDDEFTVVKWGVADALGLVDMQKAIFADAPTHPHILEEKVKALEDELKVIGTSHDNQEKLINMLRKERDAALNVADQTHADNIDASIRLEKEKAKAQFYREMYDTLLDKLISAKGVSANE